MQASPALEEYVWRGQGSHRSADRSRDPLGQVHDSSPTEPLGAVEPAGHSLQTFASGSM